MIFGRENKVKKEIIAIGKKLYALRLVVAHAGNLSSRMNEENILITATGTSLGSLSAKDIIKVNLSDGPQDKAVTSEFPLHNLVYKNFPAQRIIHCHPTLINAYFAVCPELKTLTFETKLYLGDIPLVEQETPAITRPELVIEALKRNNLVVIRNHGVVAIGDKFSHCLYLIESLEEAVKAAAVARLFKKDILDALDKGIKENLTSDKAYLMFSPEHIRAIVELVNKDELIAGKGRELDLTVKLAVKLDGTGQAYRFNFEKGKIVRLDFDADAPFVISAPREVWELVFAGKLNSFVAVTQGKMKLSGQLGQLSKWYVPFNRLFELFKEVPFK
jgi:L-fuculose-phosphate aldolase